MSKSRPSARPSRRRRAKIRLGVNIDHAATLRQVRGGTTSYPDLLRLTKICQASGAQQITIHLREDRRHIQDTDLRLLAQKCPLELNLEMAATEEMRKIALRHKPDWACFVPEKRRELTTEGGLDVHRLRRKIRDMVTSFRRGGIRSSMFIDPAVEQVRASAAVGAEAIELHTGAWVRLRGPAKRREWLRLVAAAEMAHSLGLRVHAGHGLDFQSARDIRSLPHLVEVNIGHSLICYSLETGLGPAVRKMREALV